MTALVMLCLISGVVFSGKIMFVVGFSLEVSSVTVSVFTEVVLEYEDEGSPPKSAEDEERPAS